MANPHKSQTKHEYIPAKIIISAVYHLQINYISYIGNLLNSLKAYHAAI